VALGHGEAASSPEYGDSGGAPGRGRVRGGGLAHLRFDCVRNSSEEAASGGARRTAVVALRFRCGGDSVRKMRKLVSFSRCKRSCRVAWVGVWPHY
jgi:hypothetical protein